MIKIENLHKSFGSNDVLRGINLDFNTSGITALLGPNGSGKTTLIKAILNNKSIVKTGSWELPFSKHIGYLDQHYSNLDPLDSVVDHIHKVRPDWERGQVRKHLNDFLFRANEEVFNQAKNLSGGEKARLSLALIAAQVPKLLILDEITNNLDLETKEHVVQILREYHGAIIIISHDKEFLDDIGIDQRYKIHNNSLTNQ